jgi:flagellar hook protein FlgE
VHTDLGVVGEGWFLLEDASRQNRYIRDRGDFVVDQDGYVVSPQGHRLTAALQAVPGLVSFSVLRLPKMLSTPLHPGSLRFDSFGNVTYEPSEGQVVIARRLLLARVPPPDWLEPAGPHEYRLLGPCSIGNPGSEGYGSIYQGGLSMQPAPLLPTRLQHLGRPRPTDATGALITTSAASDLAIHGPGFFLVRDPDSAQSC